MLSDANDATNILYVLPDDLRGVVGGGVRVPYPVEASFKVVNDEVDEVTVVKDMSVSEHVLQHCSSTVVL